MVQFLFSPTVLLECGRSRGGGLSVSVGGPGVGDQGDGCHSCIQVTRVSGHHHCWGQGRAWKWPVEGSLFLRALSCCLVPYVYW